MKILFINDSISRLGGVEKIWTERMNLLAEKYKIDVYLITTNQGTHPFTFPISPSIHHIDLGIMIHQIYRHPQPQRFFLKCKLERSIKKNVHRLVKLISPNIITVTSYEANIYISDLECSAKIIVESHAAKSFTLTDGVKRSLISNIYQKYHECKNIQAIKNKSDIIVTLTHDDAKIWKTKNTIVIPNFVDLHNREHCKHTQKTALFIGRFTYQKGLERMLEAWKIVVSKRDDWTLKLVGEGEQKEYLIQLCHKLGIADNVTFVPATKDVVKEYINSSLFLLTSRFEGLALVMIEATQCGVPCISFDCPYGPSDIIDDGVNGYIVENGNVEEFAKATLKLIEDDELRKKMGKAAIEKAKQYLPENIMPKWLELYNGLLTK